MCGGPPTHSTSSPPSHCTAPPHQPATTPSPTARPRRPSSARGTCPPASRLAAAARRWPSRYSPPTRHGSGPAGRGGRSHSSPGMAPGRWPAAAGLLSGPRPSALHQPPPRPRLRRALHHCCRLAALAGAKAGLVLKGHVLPAARGVHRLPSQALAQLFLAACLGLAVPVLGLDITEYPGALVVGADGQVSRGNRADARLCGVFTQTSTSVSSSSWSTGRARRRCRPAGCGLAARRPARRRDSRWGAGCWRRRAWRSRPGSGAGRPRAGWSRAG